MAVAPLGGVTVTFDGHDLTSRFLVTDIRRPRPSFSSATQDNPAGGSFLLGTRPRAKSISMTLRIRGDSGRRQALARELASWLTVDGERELSFSDDDGLVYMAVPDGETSLEPLYWGEALGLSFLAPEPVMLGERGRAQAYMPMSVTEVDGPVSPVVMVGGTAPARMVITSEDASRDPSTGLWGVRLDDGGYARVEIPVSAPSSVTIDCVERTATVNGAPALLTLDSDWLEMPPGRHVIRLDEGHGTADVSWRERWLT